MSTPSSRKDSGRVGVVLIHGLTGTPVEMKPLEKHLRRLGFDVENVLLAGHGGHHREILTATWQQWLTNVRDSLRKILERNDRAIVCGLSMGAILASAVAAEDDRVCGAVLMSPTWAYDGSVMLNKAFDALVKIPVIQNSVRNLVGWFPALGEKIFWEETPPYGLRDERLQRQITRSIEEARKGGSNEFGTFRTYYGPLWQMWALVDHARLLLSKVRCPVMMVSSLEDTIASINNATTTYLEIGSDNKALVLLTGCDHVMTLDLQKQQLFKLIGKFVQEYGRAASVRPVIEALAPMLHRETPDTRGGALTMTLSPNACGLTTSEWADLYPDLTYSPAVRDRVSSENHSLVARNNGNLLLHIPVSVSTVCLHLRKIAGILPVLGLTARPSSMIAMGLQHGTCPPIGVRTQSDYGLYVRAWSFSLEIFEALGRNRHTDWYAYQGLSRKAFLQLQSKKSLESRLDGVEAQGSLPLYQHRNSIVNWFVRASGGMVTPVAGETRSSGPLAEEMLSAT